MHPPTLPSFPPARPSPLVPVDFLVPLPDAVALFDRISRMDSFAALLGMPARYVRCWTPSITLVAMILGHLVGKGSLGRILALMRAGVADSLSKGGAKLSSLLETCASTSALAQARSRLPLAWLRRVMGGQAHELRSLAGGWQWHGLDVRVLDGTMITMRPFGHIPKRFPAHSNQHGTCYWCQMRVLACMCLGTGMILSLITGSALDSEQAQAVRLILFGGAGGPPVRPGSVLWMGDANFGVWRLTAAAHQRQQLVLLRLTRTRAAKLAGSRTLTPGLDLAVTWSPSAADQIDRGLRGVAVNGRLIVTRLERAGYRPLEMLLFTTVESPEISVAQLVSLYHRRWKIELSLRHFKSQMGLGELSARSPGMARRELLTGAMAYNLVRGLMHLGAATHRRDVWQLSFAQARQELLSVVLQTGTQSQVRRLKQWERILPRLNKGRLRGRRKPRPCEPRLKRHRRETFPPLRGDREAARQALLAESQMPTKS